jgi:hypothetical protein
MTRETRELTGQDQTANLIEGEAPADGRVATPCSQDATELDRHEDAEELGRACPACLPSPEEILIQCLAIQAEWSEVERRSRAVHLTPPTRWQVPVRRLKRHEKGREG